MAEVHRDNLRRIGPRTDVSQSVEHQGQCRHVEVTGAVVEVISEGLFDEDHVVRRVAQGLEVVDQARVGRVEQASARGAGDVVEHGLGCHLIRRAALMARRDHGRAVGASRRRQSKDISRRHFVQLDGGARTDPVAAGAHDRGWPPHVEGVGRGIPVQPQQQCRIEMVGMRVCHKDVVHVAQGASGAGDG